MRTRSPLHAVTWLVWAVGAAACVQLASNPLYVALVVAICFLVVSAHRLDTTLARAFPILVGLGVTFAVIRVVLTALTTHSADPTYLWFTLPSFTLPRILGGFTVGGTIEGDVVLYAAAQAFAVVGILAAFGVFNAVASHHELVQATPRAFHEPGLIVTVALAFVPSTMTAIAAAREADRARTGGQVVRSGRLVRLTVPILESGLERAVALAESMDARGFARTERGPADRWAGWCALGSLVALAGAFVALVGRASGAALALGAAGVVLLVAAVALSSGSVRTSRYRPRSFTRLDLGIGAVALMAPMALAVLDAATDAELFWTPYPLAVPSFALAPALAIALLAVPALVPPLPIDTSSAPEADARAERATVAR